MLLYKKLLLMTFGTTLVFCMEYVYQHLSRSYVIQRDLDQMNCAKCAMLGSVLMHTVYRIQTTVNLYLELLTIIQF